MAAADTSSTVAAHYNAVPEKGLEERTKSRIFYLRNFNNWVKSMLIGEFLRRLREKSGRHTAISVLDLCCGKGGDLLKWKKGNIKKLICSDIADVSLEQCKSRYQESVERQKHERQPQHLFDAEFIHADCSKVRLKDKYADSNTLLDLCSCQFSLHYSFASEEQAKCMLRNACESLKPGGFFIGTIPNCPLLVSETRKRPDRVFKNDVCSAVFDYPSILDDDGGIPLFGATYRFTLDEVVMDCPEYLIHFPLLEHLLKDFGMELVYKKTFAQILDEFGAQGEGRGLLGRMQALEPYPPDEDIELMGGEGQYSDAKTKLEEVGTKGIKKIGTLSKSEWEVACLYLAFGFQKTKNVQVSGD